MAHLINGKEISLNIRNEIKTETEAFAEKTGVRPGLAVIIVGEDPVALVPSVAHTQPLLYLILAVGFEIADRSLRQFDNAV